MITICAASSGRMEFKMNQKLFDYIKKAPTAYHACANSAKILEEQGIEVCILKLCKIKPINREAVEFASNFDNVWFFEEGIKNGGIARNFSDMLIFTNFKGNYYIKAINDKFVKQMSVSEALAMLKLDAKGMVDVITKNLKEFVITDEKKT